MVLTLLCSASVSLASISPREIVKRSLDRMALRARGAVMTMVMHLKEKGSTSPQVRTFHARASKKEKEARTLVRFLTPSDVAGTAFLFVQRSGASDLQYMYLPALRSVRRIVGKQKQGRFMGSDFSYADLEWRDMREARYERQPDQSVGSDDCHVIDSIPKHRGEYGRVRSWIRKRDHVPLKVKFYDHRGELKKLLFVKRIRRVQGKLMVTELKMVTRRTGHSTLLKLRDIRLRENLPARAFSMRALREQ
jgi:hypothetical protein